MQLEIICDNCDEHFIIVTKRDVDEDQLHCPFCSMIIDLEEDKEDIDDDIE